MHTFILALSRLPTHPKNRFCAVFYVLACAQFKNDKLCILGLKFENALTKVWICIIFVEIECNLVIMWYRVTLLYINLPILILKYKYCCFFLLLNFAWSGVLKIVQTIFQGGSQEIGKTKVCIKSFGLLKNVKKTPFKMFWQPRN